MELPNHVLDHNEQFLYVVPKGTFSSSDNSTLQYSVESPNGWIKRKSGMDSLHYKHDFFRPRYIEVVGDFCYSVDTFFGLRIIDTADHDELRIISEMFLPYSETITVSGDYVFMSTSSEDLYIIDCTDIYSPSILDIVDIPGVMRVDSMESEGDFLYLGTYDQQLRVVNISDINGLDTIEILEDLGGYAKHIEVSEDEGILIFLVSDFNLHFYDISDKSAISEIVTFYDDDRISFFMTLPTNNGMYLIYRTNNNWVRIVDISDLPSVVQVWEVYASGTDFTYDEEDEVVYWIRSQSLYALRLNSTNVSYTVYDSDDNIFLGRDCVDIYDATGYKNVAYSEEKGAVFVGCDFFGLYEVNVTFSSSSDDDASFEVVNQLGEKSGDPQYCFLDGDYLFVLLRDYKGFMIFDVSDITNPQNVYFDEDWDDDISLSFGVRYSSEFMFLTGSHFVILNVSDIENPSVVSTYDFGSNTYCRSLVFVDEHLAYAAVDKIVTAYIHLFDFSNLIDIKYEEWVSEDVEDIGGFDVFEDTLFAGTGKGIYVYDISSSLHSPELVAVDSTYHPVNQVHYNEKQGNLYIVESTSFRYIRALDISNISSMTTISSRMKITCQEMIVVDDLERAYVLQTSSLEVYDISNIIGAGFDEIYTNYDDIVDSTSMELTPDAGYVITVSSGGVYVFGGDQLVLLDDPSTSFSCGNITVTLEAFDSSNTSVIVGSTFWIFRDFDATDPGGLCGAMGDCFDHDLCDCYLGWEGLSCDDPICFNISTDSHLICNARGRCLSPDECECYEPEIWYGPECSYHFCWGIGSMNFSYVCGGHGNCVEKDRCLCDQGYSSVTPFGNCDLYYCNEILYSETQKVCSGGRGVCKDHNMCECEDGYEGEDCQSWSCFGIDYSDYSRICSGKGECKKPDECSCDSMHTGSKCETNLYYYTIMTPMISIASICIFSCLLVLCLGVCFLCFIGFLVLNCCLCGLSGVVAKQTVGLRKFGKLKNFDLLLAEQELEEDTSIAHLRINKSLFEIPFEELKLLSILGEGGSCSVVYKANWNSRIVAFKCFKTRTVCASQISFDEFEREVAILGFVRHPNILQFYGCSLNPPRIGILMEFCENGDLHNYISRKKKVEGDIIGFSEKIRICYEIILPMVFLHSRSIIHRDIKCENILLDNVLTCKLMDFGLSRTVDQMGDDVKTKNIGTSIYMAPELITSSYDEKIDVFAFGMCMFVIMTENFHPYGIDVMSIELRVASDPSLRPDLNELKEMKEEIPREYIDWLSDVIQRCWEHEFSIRPSFKELGAEFGDFYEKIKEKKFVHGKGGNDRNDNEGKKEEDTDNNERSSSKEEEGSKKLILSLREKVNELTLDLGNMTSELKHVNELLEVKTKECEKYRVQLQNGEDSESSESESSESVSSVE